MLYFLKINTRNTTEHFKQKGKSIRDTAKELVLSYMQKEPLCQKNAIDIRLSELFRNCGLDWGEYKN